MKMKADESVNRNRIVRVIHFQGYSGTPPVWFRFRRARPWPGICGGESNETNYALEKRFSVTEGLIPQGLNVHIKSVLWDRAAKTWVATIRNGGSVAAKISIAGFPLENGAPGMTFWANDVNLAPNHETQLSGDYRNFEVPPGTRLKVHVILKPSGAKLDEKIIVMD